MVDERCDVLRPFAESRQPRRQGAQAVKQIGAELGAKAPPDGYSLLLSPNSLVTINPHVYKKLAYDPQRDLQPVTQLTSGGNVVVLHPSVQANTLKELIDLAKAQPGKINFATTGTNNLLATEYFSLKAGIK